MFKQNKWENKIYCDKCKKYQPIETKELVCCDCHKPFKTDGIVKNKKRCDKCQDIANTERKRRWWKKNH